MLKNLVSILFLIGGLTQANAMKGGEFGDHASLEKMCNDGGCVRLAHSGRTAVIWEVNPKGEEIEKVFESEDAVSKHLFGLTQCEFLKSQLSKKKLTARPLGQIKCIPFTLRYRDDLDETKHTYADKKKADIRMIQSLDRSVPAKKKTEGAVPPMRSGRSTLKGPLHEVVEAEHVSVTCEFYMLYQKRHLSLDNKPLTFFAVVGFEGDKALEKTGGFLGLKKQVSTELYKKYLDYKKDLDTHIKRKKSSDHS